MSKQSPAPTLERDLETELHDAMAACALDPLAFVELAYPWPINGEPGPDKWQREFLEELGQRVRANAFDGVNAVAPIRMGASTGHGVGKSALSAWIVDWIMSTRRNCRGTVTANTNDQLATKTWAAIREWTSRCITAHWFEINSQIMYRIGHRSSWFCSPASCAAENSEAFAGQHAKSSTSFYVNDEDSNVPDKIHEVEEGGLTDGEPMMFLWGNPTRNSGKFHEYAFGKGRDRWSIRVIDSRESKFANKTLIQEWAQDYGEDSDFFRVRVRGLPPNADELQFIDGARISRAGINILQPVYGEPLIAGVDVSGGGSAWTVCRFRRGFDARSIRPIRLTGEQTVANDRQMVIAKLSEAILEHKPDAMFIDSAFGAVIVSRLRQMGYTNVFEVNFGAPSANPHDANMRATMWRSLKEWLPTGAIDQNDVRLCTDLAAPGFHLNKKNQLVLESKESMQKRNIASPDDGDALALTWGGRIAPTLAHENRGWAPQSTAWAG
jgi:hypothetical protein